MDPDDDEIPDGPCLDCDGSGYLDDDQQHPCPACDGTGIESDDS